MSTTNDRIEELEAALKAAKEVQRREADERRKSVTPRMVYTIEPATKVYDRIYDPAIVMYRLEGTCTNIAECEAVGHVISTGGMNYLYNTATNCLVMSVGGGHVYIGGIGHVDDNSAAWAFDRIGEFLANNPEGGDITPIVEQAKREAH